MSNIELYNNAFIECFNIEKSQLSNLECQSIKSWNSIGHMTLITILEEVFGIMIESDDVINFSSYKKGIEILTKNYNIQFE